MSIINERVAGILIESLAKAIVEKDSHSTPPEIKSGSVMCWKAMVCMMKTKRNNLGNTSPMDYGCGDKVICCVN